MRGHFEGKSCSKMANLDSGDVLRCIAGFLSPRNAQRLRRVCRLWQRYTGTRCWYARTHTPLMANLNRLTCTPPHDVIVVDDDEMPSVVSCYLAMDHILNRLIPCPSTLMVRPLPVPCLPILTRVLQGRSRPHDLDIEIPMVQRMQRDTEVGCLVSALVSSPVPMNRLAVGVCLEHRVQIQRILRYAYSHCLEVVVRVRSPPTLQDLCRAMTEAGAAGSVMRCLTVRTTWKHCHRGEEAGAGLTEALQVLPAGLSHLELDLTGSIFLGDFEYLSRQPVWGTGPRLERLRLRLGHTGITVRGLGLLLKAFEGIHELDVDIRHNGWSTRDWNILGRLCHGVASLVVTSTRDTDDDGWESILRQSLRSCSQAVLCVIVPSHRSEAAPTHEEEEDGEVTMEGHTGL